jgi:hypothetical protein
LEAPCRTRVAIQSTRKVAQRVTANLIPAIQV